MFALLSLRYQMGSLSLRERVEERGSDQGNNSIPSSCPSPSGGRDSTFDVSILSDLVAVKEDLVFRQTRISFPGPGIQPPTQIDHVGEAIVFQIQRDLTAANPVMANDDGFPVRVKLIE